MSDPTVRELPLAPLGAGDLIDRAVRLYRRHLFVLIRTAAPPCLVTAAGSILLGIAGRQVFQTSSGPALFLYSLLAIGSFFVVIAGSIFSFVVMGGAARVLVAHLLRNEAVTARAAYQAVRMRFWGLVVTAVMVVAWIVLSLMAALVGSYFVFILIAIGGLLLSTILPTEFLIVGYILMLLLAIVLSTWIFFFVAGRVAYVPQVMLVEGRGVLESFGRSFQLARGNVRRLIAMTLFTTFATYSALMILVFPLGVVGYLSGVNPFNSAQWPAWYTIGYSVAGPLSSILLTPIWMLGLSLLYVDERVRHEGYDIELLASRQLGEMPTVDVSSPFGPALSTDLRKLPLPPPPMATGSVLNLR
ncbi:MAG TPA: hypothetical protein VKB46_20850 [Pyrinomonadaceae bacterium]|nr:hypothetical protein [Pyrinomonadaceae bacterium]